jgi:hypothetical protein
MLLDNLIRPFNFISRIDLLYTRHSEERRLGARPKNPVDYYKILQLNDKLFTAKSVYLIINRLARLSRNSLNLGIDLFLASDLPILSLIISEA